MITNRWVGKGLPCIKVQGVVQCQRTGRTTLMLGRSPRPINPLALLLHGPIWTQCSKVTGGQAMQHRPTQRQKPVQCSSTSACAFFLPLLLSFVSMSLFHSLTTAALLHSFPLKCPPALSLRSLLPSHALQRSHLSSPLSFRLAIRQYRWSILGLRIASLYFPGFTKVEVTGTRHFVLAGI